MPGEQQPMFKLVVQVAPQGDGGVIGTVGVSGLSAEAVPVAVAAVQAVVGSTPASVTRGDLFRLLKKPGEVRSAVPSRQVTESVSLEFCPLLGPCRRWPAASSPACAPDLGRASEQAPCAACRHAGSPDADR